MPSYGLIVEGDTDSQVFQHLIKKVNSPDASIYPLTCGGVGKLVQKFPDWLNAFERVHDGGPVDGALVIRDCDNKTPTMVLRQMKEKLGRKTYRFPVEFCAVRRKLDSWLLADENAINKVSRGKVVARVNEAIEDINDPKERLQEILNEVKLKYTAAVLGEIAAVIELEELERRVPSFKSFKESVLNIYR